MTEKMASHHEEVANRFSVDEETNEDPYLLEDNYSGLDVRTCAVYISVNLIAMTQILNLVGSGAFASNIAAAVGGSNNTVWLSSAIAILTCVLGPPVSQAADYWGRKWFIVVLTLIGAIGCIIVSRTTTMDMAIAGEIIAGLAYGCQPLLYAVASEILPRQYRPVAQAGVNIAIGLGGIFSILVGSTLTANYFEGFRIFWYITTAIQVISALILAVLYHPPPRPESALTFKEKINRLDWLGYALLASGIVLFSIALSWSQNPYSWTDGHVLATFLVGIVLLLALAVYQTRFKSDGIFHHGLFKKDRNFAISVLCIFVEGMVFFALNEYFAFEMGVLFETNTFMVGVRLSIVFFTSMISCIGIAVYSSITRELRLPTVVAFISFVIFNTLMATATLSSGTAVWGYPVFMGFGLGVCLTCIVTAAQLSAPPALIAISSGLMISTRSLGGSVGLAIYNAIFNSRIATELPAQIAAAVLPLGLSPKALPDLIEALSANDQAALGKIQGLTPQIIGAAAQGLQEAYLISFRYIWVTAAAFSAAAALASAFMVNPRKDLNMHVDAPLREIKNEKA